MWGKLNRGCLGAARSGRCSIYTSLTTDAAEKAFPDPRPCQPPQRYPGYPSHLYVLDGVVACGVSNQSAQTLWQRDERLRRRASATTSYLLWSSSRAKTFHRVFEYRGYRGMSLAGDGSGIITADCGRRAVGSEATHKALRWVGPETDIAISCHIHCLV